LAQQKLGHHAHSLTVRVSISTVHLARRDVVAVQLSPQYIVWHPWMFRFGFGFGFGFVVEKLALRPVLSEHDKFPMSI
jgi:hypothetical protein